MSGLGHIWMDELTPEREAEVTIPGIDEILKTMDGYLEEGYVDEVVEYNPKALRELRAEQVDVLRQCIERARYSETRVRELIASNRWLEDELVKARSRQ
jgi:hypothetical protein